ncbi:ABC transporter permease [Blastopirellula marina]|nr:ABC transporter permease [Blastopirellula marina]
MNKSWGMLFLLVLICVVTAIFRPRFVEPGNLANIIRWTSLYGVMGIGVAFVIITGGIDLSIGSMLALVGSLFGVLMAQYNLPPAAAIMMVLVMSTLLGLVYGLLITKLKLQPFVVTLCGLLILRGLARATAGGSSVGGFQRLSYLINYEWGSIPVPFLPWINEGYWSFHKWLPSRGDQPGHFALNDAGERISLDWYDWVPLHPPILYLAAIAIIAAIFLNWTVFGRHLKALGKNEQAARYSGVRTDTMVIISYMICTAMAGVAGVLFSIDIGSVMPSTFGNFYELYAIAAAVLGGCSLRGGEGSIIGVVIGTAILRVLQNSIEMWSIQELEFAVVGGVILIGVIADEIARRIIAQRRASQEAALLEKQNASPS